MKRLGLLLIVLTAGVIIIGLLLGTSNRVPDLAAIGTRVPGFHTTSTLYLHKYWRSDTEIEIYEPQGGHLILNVETGQVARYQTPYLASHRMHLPGMSYLSPDRQRVLRRGHTRWELLDSAGRPTFTWPLTSGQAYWAPNGKSWLLIDYSHRNAYRYSLTSSKPTLFPLRRSITEPILYDGDDKLILPGNRWSKGNLETLHLSKPELQDVRKSALPVGTETVFEVKANPQGDRIAWYVGRGVNRPTWVEKLLRVLRVQLRGGGINAPSVDTEGIWVSRVDGSEMRPVGEVVAEWAPVGMGSFTWCPDGKHVLITYRNGIYKVPVD